MKNVIIINERTMKIVSTCKIKEDEIKEKFSELKNIYRDVSIDIDGDIIAWAY